MNNKSPTLSDSDLTFAIENGIIDESHVRLQVEEMRKKQALENHENKIWQNKTTGYYMTYLHDQNGKRKLVKKKNYQDILNAIAGIEKGKEKAPTFEQEYRFWMNDRVNRNRVKKATQKRYDEIFAKYFVEIKNIDLGTTKPYRYQRFLESIVPEFDMTAKAYSNVVIILRGVLKLAKRQGWIDFSVNEMISDADVSDRQFRKVYHEDREEVFNEQEMEKITYYLKRHRDLRNDCIYLMFGTGIRVGEAVALKPENIEQRVIHIRATETKYRAKNGKCVCEVADAPKTEAGIRDVVVPEEYQWLTKSLIELSKGQEYVFMENGVRFNTDVIRGRLKRLCDKLGIYPKSPHKIRKTYCSILLDHGLDSKMITEQVGHTNIGITEEHYHRNRHTLDEKEQLLSAIEDFK